MAMVTSQPLSMDNKDRLHDASFSSYLNSSEHTHARKLVESGMNPNSIFLARKKAEEGEIGVFGAEKYFNGVVDEENPSFPKNGGIKIHYPTKKEPPVDTSPVKPRIQPNTPSVHSVSSWNSRSALLQSLARNPSQRKSKKRNGKNFLSSLGCSCPCGKNSVDVDENVGETNSKGILSCGEIQGEMVKNDPDTGDLARIKSGLNPWVMEEIHCKKIEEMGNELNREDCFTFPVLPNSKPGNPIPVNSQENEDEKQRNSLEVFGSPVLDKKNDTKSLSLERNSIPAMWTWETNSRGEEAEIPPGSDGMYNGNESDASSDLFEIESFTTSGNSFPLTPTTCYAPSEASIDWSVVTASGAGVVSDSEDLVNSEGRMNAPKTVPNGRIGGGGKEMEKRRSSGILLSCKSYRAVRVVGDAHMRNGNGNGNGNGNDNPKRRHRSSRDGQGIYGGKGK